jgi:hypothetical protein
LPGRSDAWSRHQLPQLEESHSSRGDSHTDETLGRGGGTVRGILGEHYGEATHRSPPLDRGSPATTMVMRHPTRASELDQPSLVTRLLSQAPQHREQRLHGEW